MTAATPKEGLWPDQRSAYKASLHGCHIGVWNAGCFAMRRVVPSHAPNRGDSAEKAHSTNLGFQNMQTGPMTDSLLFFSPTY